MKFRQKCTGMALILLTCFMTACGHAAPPAKEITYPTKEEKAQELVAKMSLEEKIGQMFIVGMAGTSPTAGDLDMISKYHVGGFIHFDRNLDTPDQVKLLNENLQNQAKAERQGIPLFICVDQEGGQVARMREYLPVAPSAAEIGASGDPQIAREWARKTAKGLADLGFNTNFAPVADLGFTHKRSYGTTAGEVTHYVLSALAGYKENNMMCAVKHYPGIGKAMVDPHADTSKIEASQQELLENDMLPFQSAVETQNNKDFMVMVSHLVYPAYENVPASVSKVLLTEVLRKQWGYKGIIITDDLAMGGLANLYTPEEMGPLAVLAGNDILLSCGGDHGDTIAIYNSVLQAVKNGEIPESRIDASVERILLAKDAKNLIKL